MELEKLLNLESNKCYDNYEYSVNNIDYVVYKSSFNIYLKKFINYCFDFNIKLYFKKDDIFYFLTKEDVLLQLNDINGTIVKNHINMLQNIANTDITDYIKKNKEITDKNMNLIKKINKFVYLTEIIYKYKLLHTTNVKCGDLDEYYTNRYNNLVNLSKLKPHNETIKIIDSYSWSNIS